MARTFQATPATPYKLAVTTQQIQLGIKKVANPRCVPVTIPWANYGASAANPNVGVFVNLAGTVQTGLDRILSVYIDNTNSPTPVYVQFLDTGYVVSCQPYADNFSLVLTNTLAANVFGEGFTNADPGQVNVFFLNTSVNPFTNIELAQAVELRLASPTVISPSPIFNGRYGVPALGDLQANLSIEGRFSALSSIILPAKVSGFYIITGVSIFAGLLQTSAAAGGEITLSLFSGLTQVFSYMVYTPGSADVPSITYNNRITERSGMNIKLDATVDWSFGWMNGSGGTQVVTSMNLDYTYTQI